MEQPVVSKTKIESIDKTCVNPVLKKEKLPKLPVSVTSSEIVLELKKEKNKTIAGVDLKQQTLKKTDVGDVLDVEEAPSTKNDTKPQGKDSHKAKSKDKKEVRKKEASDEKEEFTQRIDNSLDEDTKIQQGNVKKIVKKKESKKKISKKTNRVLNDNEKSDQKQSTITQHFQVRRSERKPKCLMEKEARLVFEEKILSGDENNLEVRLIKGKGRGVFSKVPLRRGDLVCEYAGELISRDEAGEREKQYSETPEVGCYMYYFEYAGKKYCIDATKETGKLGRLLNHSKTNANVYTRLFPIKNKPYLILVAARDVELNEELLYDYGERNKTAIESHPWLKS